MKSRPLDDPLVRSGFLILLLGLVLTIVGSSGNLAVQWLGVALLFAGLGCMLYPLWKRRQREREERSRHY